MTRSRSTCMFKCLGADDDSSFVLNHYCGDVPIELMPNALSLIQQPSPSLSRDVEVSPRPLSNIYEFVKTMKMPLLYQNGKAPRRSAESGHELEDA